VIKKQQILVEDLYSMSPSGRYWYQGGVHLKAVYALIPASIVEIGFGIEENFPCSNTIYTCCVFVYFEHEAGR
jgi:cytosine/uracil/thiamine/allantoin permease